MNLAPRSSKIEKVMCLKNSPNTSLLTTMLQLYIGVTMRCGCFWKALRHPSFIAEMI